MEPVADARLDPNYALQVLLDISHEQSLERLLRKVVEGPVARQGGRRKGASSVYVRDPDGNLLEFMIYS